MTVEIDNDNNLLDVKRHIDINIDDIEYRITYAINQIHITIQP